MEFHPSWPTEASKHFLLTIKAHGGWEAWCKNESFAFTLKEFSGALVFAKGLNRTFFPPKTLTVYPKKRIVEFNYGEHTDLFENGKITYSPARKTVADGRKLFRSSTFEQWRPEHAAYFFGYAWANYLSYPFILPQFELLAFRLRRDRSFFKIRFSENFHTHCRIQDFYFGPDHLLSRHDYQAEFAGPLVFGAHSTDDYVTHQGLQIGFIRKVRPRIGQLPLPIYGIYGEIEF